MFLFLPFDSISNKSFTHFLNEHRKEPVVYPKLILLQRLNLHASEFEIEKT